MSVSSYRVKLINAYELLVDSGTKLTLTGTRSSRAYRFGPPREVEVGICRSCLGKKSLGGYFWLVLGCLILFATIVVVGMLAAMLFVTTIGARWGWVQSAAVPWAFAFGALAAVALFTGIIVSSISRDKAKGDARNTEEAKAAMAARLVLNERRPPDRARWFTPREWESVMATGIHPDSDEAYKLER
jgi:membrane protein implicated in regulation of membrane protease activity